MVDAFGFAAGGVADELGRIENERFNRGQLELGQQRLDLGRERLGFEQNQATQQLARDRLAETSQLLLQMKQGHRGTTEDFIREVGPGVDQLLQDIDQFAVAAGMPNAGQRMRLLLQSTPTQLELAQREAQANVAGAAATAEALTEGGAPTTLGAVAQAQGMTPAPNRSPQMVQLQAERDRAIAEGRTEDAEQLQNQITRLGTVVGRTPQDVLTGTAPRDVGPLRENVRQTQAQLEELNSAAQAFAETPEAGGIFGNLIEKGGGLLQQLDRLTGIDLLPEGIDPAEVQKVRSQGRAVVSQMLETITAEESGRFTDTERQLASETLAALDPTSSVEQIQAGFQTVQEMLERSQTRQLVQLLSASEADLSTDEGLERFHSILLANGFPDDESTLAAMNRLLDRLGME